MRAKLVSALVGLAALAAMLIGAGSASAACTSVIHGEGSSLQRLAQERWSSVNNAGGCAIAEGASVSYNPSGSGAGLSAWHAEGRAGSISEGARDGFIGTDDAPTAAQIANMERASQSASIMVMPVAQAAVAVIVHLPLNCSITSITNQSLQSVWHHDINNWERVANHSGTGCNSTIRRVVRRDSSGTTYQFKHYLNYIANEVEWRRLQETAENVNWPRRTEDLMIAAATGGAAVVREVRENAGTIGYANLADAIAGGASEARILIVKVQNNGRVDAGARFAEPKEASGGAVCENAEYGETIVERRDWSEVYGSRISWPAEQATAYPICTLTFDVVVLEYVRAGFGAIGRQVREFFRYGTLREAGKGQTILAAEHYGVLPAAIETATKPLVERIR